MNQKPLIRKIENKKGFALISTIVIMSLLLMVSLAMLGLSAQTSRTVVIDQHETKAKANARLAMMLALGELQQEMGPDQRISANASILDTKPSDDTSYEGVLNPHWVGVYDSDREMYPTSGYGGRTEQKFRRWLVSQKDEQRATTLGTANLDLDDGVELVGKGTLGSIAETSDMHKVFAERLMVEDGAGSMAWWVGDLSAKAKLNPLSVMDPTGNSREEYQANLQSAPAPSAAGDEAMSWLDIENADHITALGKTFTQNTIKLVGSGSDTFKTGYHDYTIASRGLPVNARDGGLKYDLTRLFSSPDLPAEFVYGQKEVLGRELDIGKPLYESQGSKAAPDWKRLSDYHQFTKLVKWDNGKPYVTYDQATWADLRVLSCAPPLPILVRIQVFYSITMGTSNRLALVVEPVITLWNPYNVELRLPSSASQLFMRSFWQSLQVVVFRNGQRINGTSYHRNLFYPTYPNTNMRFALKDVVLKPGESQVFSDQRTEPFNWNANNTTWGHNITSKAGWNNKGGFLGDGYGNFGTANGGQTISVQINPMQTLHSENSDYGQKNTNLYHQMDLIANDGGLWGPNTFKSYQSFRIKNHSATDIKKLWGNGFTRNNISVSSLYGRKVPLCVVDVAARTEQDDTAKESLPFLFSSSTHGSVLSSKFSKAISGNTFWTSTLRSISDWDTQTVEVEPNTNRGYYGAGNTAGTGTPFYVAREIPLYPPMSIAAYRNFDVLFSPDVYNHWGGGKVDPGQHTVHPAATQVIGNSLAHPLLSRNKIVDESLDLALTPKYLDHSYHLNHALYDQWFHSGLGEEELKAIRDRRSLGPNKRMLFDLPEDIDTFITQIQDKDIGYRKVAEHTMVDGAFNVNCTSKKAWMTLLSSLKSQHVPVFQPTGNGVEMESNEGRVPFPRVTVPAAASVDEKNTNPWHGFRSLTDEDIEQLAENIVEQVKVRGPFLSLSDFVNRRVSTQADDNSQTQGASKQFNLSLHGALQAAIDDTTINSRMFTVMQDDALVDAAGYRNPEAAKGLRGAGAPGYLTQGDLMQALGSTLTVRGDTFTIRAYGDSRDTKGAIAARAWCEVTVQRVSEYCDPSNDAVDRGTELSELNQKFGRKFKVIAFRWMNEDEI